MLSNSYLLTYLYKTNLFSSDIVNKSDKKVLNAKRPTGKVLKIETANFEKRLNKVLNYTKVSRQCFRCVSAYETVNLWLVINL